MHYIDKSSIKIFRSKGFSKFFLLFLSDTTNKKTFIEEEFQFENPSIIG